MAVDLACGCPELWRGMATEVAGLDVDLDWPCCPEDGRGVTAAGVELVADLACGCPWIWRGTAADGVGLAVDRDCDWLELWRAAAAAGAGLDVVRA